MLKGISPIISPSLLKVLSEMGHGDEIVLADAHFPGHSIHSKVLRKDGVLISDLLSAILPLFELDSYSPAPILMMDAVKGDTLDPKVELSYLKSIKETNPEFVKIARIERNEFYEQAKKSYAVVVTGETAKYGNIILKKGVTPLK